MEESPLIACSPPGALLSFADLRAYAAEAERSRFTCLVLDAAPGFDPLTAAAALMPLTHAIKIAVDVVPDGREPYTLARGLAALDHLSRGRAAWRIGPVTDISRTREFIDVTRKLWTSWQADAVVFDKAAAVFSDPAKVARLDHVGAAFHVRGPLNTPRPPQGRPPLLVDAASPLRDLADVVFGENGAVLVRCAASDLFALAEGLR